MSRIRARVRALTSAVWRKRFDVVQLAGLATLAGGVWSWSPPAGYVVLGAGILAWGINGERALDDD